MLYEYDINKNELYQDRVLLPLQSLEENIIGNCSNCNSDVASISYHIMGDKTVVAAKCLKCATLCAIIYDNMWNWLGEEIITRGENSPFRQVIKNKETPESFSSEPDSEEIEITEELRFLQSIPSKKLSAVFSPAEIEAMFARAAGKKYVRQYLYRARKKYQDFNELFDMIINI